MKIINLMMSMLCLCTIVGCIEEIEIKVSDSSEMIVIDAMVNDLDSVQTVYVRREREMLSEESDGRDTNPPIEGVTVHIEDDNGWSGDFINVEDRGREFTLSGHQFEPGRTYTVTVSVGERVFKATETIVRQPDFGDLKFYSNTFKDGEETWFPIFYIQDNQPDVDNYYMIANSYSWIRIYSQWDYITMDCLSDEGLKPGMNEFAMSLGIGEKKNLALGRWFGEMGGGEVYTISKSNYDYIMALKDQVESDGGVYKPSPATPVTNFSGDNVQGQFIAASKKVLLTEITEENIVRR